MIVDEEGGLRLRRATTADVPFLLRLASSDEVEPFMSARAGRTAEELEDEVRCWDESPRNGGRFVIELDTGGTPRPVGQIAFEVGNRHGQIALLHAVMVDPGVRGRGLAERALRLGVRHLVRDLGYHRVQLEVYGFNERAQRLFERAGFVREGVRRGAYWRHGAWQDGVLFGVVEDDLDP